MNVDFLNIYYFCQPLRVVYAINSWEKKNWKKLQYILELFSSSTRFINIWAMYKQKRSDRLNVARNTPLAEYTY